MTIALILHKVQNTLTRAQQTNSTMKKSKRYSEHIQQFTTYITLRLTYILDCSKYAPVNKGVHEMGSADVV